MKKLVFIFILIISFMSMPLFTYANYDNSNGNIIDGSSTVNEDLAEDKELIASQSMNSLYFFFNTKDIDDSVIDYDRASKAYFNMPFYDTEELSRNQMQEFVQNADSIYNLPVKYDDCDKFCSIVIGKGIEVTDEIRSNPQYDENDIRQFELEENRWCVTSVGRGDCEMDYNNAIYVLLNDYGIENSYVYFVNGIGDAGEIALVIFRENSDNAEFLLLDDEYAGDDGKVRIAADTDFGDRMYTYSELKEIDAQRAASIDPNEEVLLLGVDSDFDLDLTSESNYNLEYALIARGAVLGLCALALIINFASKKKVKV